MMKNTPAGTGIYQVNDVGAMHWMLKKTPSEENIPTQPGAEKLIKNMMIAAFNEQQIAAPMQRLTLFSQDMAQLPFRMNKAFSQSVITAAAKKAGAEPYSQDQILAQCRTFQLLALDEQRRIKEVVMPLAIEEARDTGEVSYSTLLGLGILDAADRLHLDNSEQQNRRGAMVLNHEEVKRRKAEAEEQKGDKQKEKAQNKALRAEKKTKKEEEKAQKTEARETKKAEKESDKQQKKAERERKRKKKQEESNAKRQKKMAPQEEDKEEVGDDKEGEKEEEEEGEGEEEEEHDGSKVEVDADEKVVMQGKRKLNFKLFFEDAFVLEDDISVTFSYNA